MWKGHTRMQRGQMSGHVWLVYEQFTATNLALHTALVVEGWWQLSSSRWFFTQFGNPVMLSVVSHLRLRSTDYRVARWSGDCSLSVFDDWFRCRTWCVLTSVPSTSFGGILKLTFLDKRIIYFVLFSCRSTPLQTSCGNFTLRTDNHSTVELFWCSGNLE